MGIQFSGIIKGSEIAIQDLAGKVVSIDSFNWIYQFLSTIRQMDGDPLMDSKGRVTSHLSGMFYRSINLMDSGLRLVYVFDGKPPKIKKSVTENRIKIRKEAEKQWKESLEKKDYIQARKYASRSSQITKEMIEESKKLLDLMGIPTIQSITEGEKLCSMIVKNNDSYTAATQDYDSLLFGCDRVVRNLSISGKKRRGNKYIEIKPEILNLKSVLEDLKINREKLIMTGMLIGTDYNPGGVEGYGPKKALLTVKKYDNVDSLFKDVGWKFETSPKEIFNFFMEDVKQEYEINFKQIEIEKLKKLLCDEHDFSEKRVDNMIKRITDKKTEQRSLSNFI